MSVPVPYVALRVGEVVPEDANYFVDVDEAGQFVAYADERLADRDWRGLLMMRERTVSDDAPAIYGEVNAHRQTRCMVDRRCQVCGEKVADPTDWLMPSIEMHVLRVTGITNTPPICAPCIDISLQHCPGLEKLGHARLIVRKWKAVGVYGELAMYEAQDGKPMLRRAHYVEARYGRPGIRNVVVKGTIAQLKDWEVVDGDA